MRPSLDSLFDSGELGRLAQAYPNRTAMLDALGLTREHWRAASSRLARSGRRLPSFDELRGAGRGAPEPLVGTRHEPQPRTIEHDLSDRKRKTELSGLRSRLSEALDQLEQCRLENSTLREIREQTGLIEPIRPRERSTYLREATAVALASDWHIEETVDAAKVNGVNEYNVDIARHRCERFFAGFIYMIRYHQDHFTLRDAILWMGGDLITGYLREENLEDNGLSPIMAIATLHVWFADGIRSLLASTEIDRFRIVCNSGNHGRLTKKVQPSTREANSIENLLYIGLAREFKDEPRVEFDLPHGVHTYIDVYDTTVRFTHGDATKFGGGVGGIMIPIRKAIAKWQTVKHADVTVMGHYHQEYFLRDLIVNGSLIGYNTYALEIAAPYEEPRQSFFLIDKSRGVTMPATLWVTDSKEDIRANQSQTA